MTEPQPRIGTTVTAADGSTWRKVERVRDYHRLLAWQIAIARTFGTPDPTVLGYERVNASVSERARLGILEES